MGNVLKGGCCDPRMDFDETTAPERITTVLKFNAIGVRTLVWINWILVWVFIVGSLINGMCLPDPFVGLIAVPHVVWMILNSFTLAIVLISTYIGMTNLIDDTQKMQRVAIAFLVISIIANIVHCALSVVELIRKETDLSQNGFIYLLIATILLGIFVIWQLLIIFRLNVFRNNLNTAVSLGWRPPAVGHTVSNDALQKQPPQGVQMRFGAGQKNFRIIKI